jgi:heme A synthase
VHFLVAGIAFLALMAACFVFARRFAAAGRRGWAAFSTVTGVLFLGTWMTTFALPGNRAANVAFAVAISLVLAWTSLLAARRLTRPGEE